MVQPICMGYLANYKPVRGIYSGWGSNHQVQHDNTRHLNYVELLKIRNCGQNYFNDIDGVFVMCFGNVGVELCKSDDGGPLIVENQISRYEIIGIAMKTNETLQWETESNPCCIYSH